MIDDDFSPNRLQYRALGHLLVHANNYPLSPSLRETELLLRVYERYVGAERPDWLLELAKHGLIRIEADSFRAGDRVGKAPANVCLTPAGSYYSISRAFSFAENARTLTDDFPDEIVDTPWVLQSYFASPDRETAPAADRIVRFDDNQEAYNAAIEALDAVSKALATDNEIGSQLPAVRDEKLAELKAIRELLEKKEGWRSKIIASGWGVLGYLMSHFADHPIAHLAEQAWHALRAVAVFG